MILSFETHRPSSTIQFLLTVDAHLGDTVSGDCVDTRLSVPFIINDFTVLRGLKKIRQQQEKIYNCNLVQL